MILSKAATSLPFALAFVGWAAPASAGQPLETETARLPAQGHVNLQLVFERHTSPTGKETAFPLAVEYGIAFGITYDNDKAVLLRTAATIRF